ncbi:phage tail protein [Pseudoflavonifractor sp. 524-17]|uniref:phage tail sheath family protein n=1 Tax=Pseudoflavonifractor sp. 524-17 TaxID=2304577 RepID=UPI00137A129E|nr:phage tail protein [Pseudoflavonifractor sp. 524-17]NCE66068.1 phage tail protein [Pseudoflavonifractor sp. 524-17]
MALNLGVHVHEKATAVSTPAVADVSIPFVVGAAPAHSADAPAKANVPVLCTSWDEAVAQLGFSYDWKRYPLCEFMYSHFQLYGCQPVVFCNVLDSTKAGMKDSGAGDGQTAIPVAEHQAALPFAAIASTIQVSTDASFSTVLELDVDYSILYDEGADACLVELLSSGAHYGEAQLYIKYDAVKPDGVEKTDIVEGLSVIDACMSTVGLVPDLICAPGWSHDSVVAAVMATKAEGVNGLFPAKALIDADTGEDGVRKYDQLLLWKNKNNIVDDSQILCWPMPRLGDYKFHMSTQLAGLMAQVDAGNGGVPCESPSNKNFKMDGLCLEDGTEVSLTFEQTNIIAGYGIVTALNFMSMGWTCRNNYTACYPGSTDVKDQFIPVSRMFGFVASTLIRTFWSKLDKPMNLRLLDNIQDTCNIWLNGLVSQEYLLGARVELRGSENPVTSLLAGIISFHIYLTPPVPAQEIHFTLEFDVDYLTSALNLAA